MKPIVYISHRNPIPETPAQYTRESLEIIDGMLRESILESCDFESLVEGKTVFIKPNLVRPNPGELPAITTDPRVVIGVIKLAKEYGAAKILVGENPGYRLHSSFAFDLWKAVDKIKAAGAEIVLLDEDEKVRVPNPRGRVLYEMSIPKTVLDADCFINIPKMKTHMHALVTLGIKNLHGLIFDEERLMFHRNDVAYKLVDVFRVIPPHLTVIDGIWAMDGQAPLSGSTINDMNVIVAGTDTVAVDAVTSELMMIAPDEVDMIRIANWEGLGEMNLDKIDIRGAQIPDVQRRFKRPVLSASGIYEKILSVEGGACKGCLSAMRHALDKLNREGGLDKLPPFTIYTGVPMPNMKNLPHPEGDIWIMGNCAVDVLQQESVRMSKPDVIYGCAPHIFDLYSALKAKYIDSPPAGTGHASTEPKK